jgi:predicted exporter
VVVAAIVATGMQMTIMHLIGMLLIVAIGSNYALFFSRRPGQESPEERARMLASLLCANLTTVAGFGLLAFSSVPVLQAIGITVGPGAVLALVFAAMLSPAPAARREAPGDVPR